ncbi:MAG: peptide-methionine (R)-S-oxide reductase MsrB [Gammaproteobacteria bacterium]|nr:peptide-methionine (R)-S-oxide reductase MsrB [Sideroxydans sp.]MBU3904138.1 peptide-methionine (R)-S-oxide reductase MsrB [Gammaproteobacteria bacterium]MBU4045961.1 peptide-methionine (R)-S-oxide reductase MsrB [Gammaproteobacteria bacterium]MBU4150536.1 peptide-methionine (R)-S-oxide reductase MsrB [Gammaproteobacteria bacterium]
MSDIDKTEEEWREELTPEQYEICRKGGTEVAFTGEYWDCHDPGVYRCICCGAPLFDAETKYESGTGWPSFWQPVREEAVEYSDEDPLGMGRIEVVCTNCGSHLGHVFEDGPEPTGLRYCLNSVSLALDRS